MKASLRSIAPWALVLVAHALLGCGASTEDKCTESCEKTLNDCGAEVACDESCAPYGEDGASCVDEADRYYDCVLDVVDGLDADEICADGASEGSSAQHCPSEIAELDDCLTSAASAQ